MNAREVLDPEEILDDIMAIMRSDVTALKQHAATRVMTLDEGRLLASYAERLVSIARERRVATDDELDKLIGGETDPQKAREKLMERARELLGGGR